MGIRLSEFVRVEPSRARRVEHAGARASTESVTGLPIGEQGLESPYVSARREWNERYGSYIARARTWQIVALGALTLSAVLGLSLVWVAAQSRVQPFIVEVDKLGQAVAVGPADKVATPDQRLIRYQLANYINHARSVTPDPVVQKSWLDEVYAVSGTAADSYLNDYYRKSDPFTIGRSDMVSVAIESALPLSKDTWQVQWTETRRSLDGQGQSSNSRWQAILIVSTFTPTTPQQIIANPTGVVVEQVNWIQQL